MHAHAAHQRKPHFPIHAYRFYATEGFYPNESNVLRMLGYFSLVSLLRVHTLVGDYYSALKGTSFLFCSTTSCFAAAIVLWAERAAMPPESSSALQSFVATCQDGMKN
eukprot:scaffold157460_cov18-Tisochrysis_lutea.AAC.2